MQRSRRSELPSSRVASVKENVNASGSVNHLGNEKKNAVVIEIVIEANPHLRHLEAVESAIKSENCASLPSSRRLI